MFVSNVFFFAGRSLSPHDDEQSLNKYCPLGKLIVILGAILDGCLACPGINFSTSINNNLFMSNMYLDCRLDCRLV